MKKIVGFFALFFIAGSANALLITQYTSLAAFDAATSGLSLETFAGEASGIFISRDFGDFRLDLQSSIPNEPAITAAEELRLQVVNSSSVLNMTFDFGINALGFNWRNTDFSGDDIELLVGGQSIVFGLDQQSGFFGITTDQLFTVAGFSDTAGDGGALDAGYIDDIRYGTCSPFPGGGNTGGCFPGPGPFPGKVPEPAAIWLFGSGLIGLIGFTKRRKAA